MGLELVNIYVDGGTKNYMACLVDESCNLAKLRQVRKRNENAKNTFEFEALIMALSYIEKRVVTDRVNIITDSLEVKRFFNEVVKHKVDKEWYSIKKKCYEKFIKLSKRKKISMTWVKRTQNLAGRVLEDCGKIRPSSREFSIKSFRCKFCNDIFTNKKAYDSHIYNRHVIIR